MIDFSLRIKNPFSNREYTSVWEGSRKLTKNKSVEAQLDRSSVVFAIGFGLSFRCDHAGLTVDLGLFSWDFTGQFYDNRHWDYKNNTWESYDDA